MPLGLLAIHEVETLGLEELVDLGSGQGGDDPELSDTVSDGGGRLALSDLLLGASVRRGLAVLGTVILVGLHGLEAWNSLRRQRRHLKRVLFVATHRQHLQ